MLNCRACLWRGTRALNVPAHNAHRLNPLLRQGQQRLLSTRDDYERGNEGSPDSGEVQVRSRYGEDHFKKSAVLANQKKRERAALRETPTRRTFDTPNLAKLGRRDPQMSDADWNNRKRELQYLQDPLELAQFVKAELRKDKLDEMLQLVRMASHSMDCVVSWNHIIGHMLAKENVNGALKVYNDMKKRAQFPDSYTYTILLRGLGDNAQTSGVLEKALSVYHSLFAPNSRIEPSIIHTNSALRVCARALDMDALWGVAGKIPETGPAAANSITYVTILNAIRSNALINGPKGETEDEAAARKDRAIMEGRRMWENIVARWRSADLVIDEELVCSMGRLLLIGSRPKDWDDVLSLVEQTMDIPRLIPGLDSSGRLAAGHPRVRAPKSPPEYRADDDHLSPDNTPVRGSEFLALTPHGVGSAISNPLAYARPGNNTLSMVQEACQKLIAKKASHEYWDLMTDPSTYDVVPDLNNYNARLRNLRRDRIHEPAVDMLQHDMVGKGIVPGPGTFRIVMSTCVRDKHNHNSLRNAGRVLEVMSKCLEDADYKTVGMYAELASSYHLAKGSDLVEALLVLKPTVHNIRLQLTIGGEDKSGGNFGAHWLGGEERQDAILVLQRIQSLYDKLLSSNLISDEQKSPLKTERAQLSSFIQRVTYKSSYLGKSTEAEQAREVDSPSFVQSERERKDDIPKTPFPRFRLKYHGHDFQEPSPVERPPRRRARDSFPEMRQPRRPKWKNPTLSGSGKLSQ